MKVLGVILDLIRSKSNSKTNAQVFGKENLIFFDEVKIAGVGLINKLECNKGNNKRENTH
jgi:hypothetical protein